MGGLRCRKGRCIPHCIGWSVPVCLPAPGMRAPGRRRRVYRLSNAGREAVRLRYDEWRTFAAGVQAVVGGVAMNEQSPIDRYLDQLVRDLRVSPGRLRRIVAEVEDHLREHTTREIAAGIAPHDAEERAIARFGSPALVARRFAAEDGPLLPSGIVLHLVLTLALLTGIGFAAIGVSGVVAAGLGTAFGKGFVAGDLPDVTYTPTRCADFLEYHPEAGDCESAAAAHHYDEVVVDRLAIGVVGLVILGGWLLVRRRYRHGAGVRVLPHGFTAIAGAALFGVATVALLAQGTILLPGSNGAGGMLSGGIVAALLSALFAFSLLRTLRTDAAPLSVD